MRLHGCSVEFPEKGIVHIVGDNRQGKTALLKMLEAMKGKGFISKQAIHNGEKKGDFTLSLGAGGKIEFIVSYSFTEKASYVKVEAADGTAYTNAQAVLTGMISPLMDPWEFVSLVKGTPAEQRRAYELLLPLMQFDFDAADFVDELGLSEDEHIKTLLTQHAGDPMSFFKGIEDSVSEVRKEWGKAQKRHEAAAESIKSQLAPEERSLHPVDLGAKIRERDAEQENRARVQRLLDRAQNVEGEVKVLEAQLAAKKEALESLRQEAMDIPVSEENAFALLTAEIKNADETNRKAAKAEQLRAALHDAKTAGDTYDDMDKVIESIREKRKEVIATAQGLAGVTLNDGEIYLNGQKMATNASTEECLSFALDVAMRKHEAEDKDSPDWKLLTLICKDASVIGAAAMEVVAEKADKHGFQVFMEEVGTEARPGVIFVADGVAENA